VPPPLDAEVRAPDSIQFNLRGFDSDAEAAAFRKAARARGAPIRAVMLERLGPNVWHDSPAAAMATLEELEETAKLWLQCDPRPAALPPAQLEELRQAFGAPW